MAFAVADVLAIGGELFLLYGMSRLVLKNQRPASLIATVLAVYISQLSFGAVNSVEAMLFPPLIRKTVLYPLLIFATLAAFVICGCCYWAALKFLSLAEDSQVPYVGILLFPGLFFFAAELYILQTSYSILPSTGSLGEAGKHSALLFLQILELAALLCTLYGYRQICRGLQTQAEVQSLMQAVQAQKTYVSEAKMRYERTKSFRHDVKNHLTVLEGLLNSGRWDEGRAYLHKLEAVSATLSFPCQTGNSVVDILLGEKLGLAELNGISAEVSLLLPKLCEIDDFDLCVIFANALDNAINACQTVEGSKSIRISGERQGDFYLLTFENSCQDGPLAPVGTGLSNVKSVAEKYYGAMLTEKNSKCFSLHVLLNISLHPESISVQKS